MKKARGTISRVAICCNCPDTRERGDFLFTGESHREKGARVSPVFPDLGALYDWCNANGWKQATQGDGLTYVFMPDKL